jgi:nitroreductase
MDTRAAIISRTSVREYNSRPIDRQALERLVDAGRMAPSARAVEPLDFIVIEDKDKLAKIACLAPNGAFIKNARAAIIVVSKNTKYYLEDGCAATENILLQAADSGIGACWIAGDKKPYADEVVDWLNCPPETRLVSIISLGYPAKTQARKKNRALSDVIHWESF